MALDIQPHTTTGTIELIREVPTGLINGTNDIYNTSLAYAIGTTQVFLNGLLLTEGDHYTELGGTAVQLDDPPLIGDSILVIYVRS